LNMACANSTRVHLLRLTMTIYIADRKDSTIGMSSPSPAPPKEGIKPLEEILLVKAQALNRVP